MVPGKQAMPATKRTAKPKPKPKRIVQRSLFDKSEVKIKPTWKQPKHDKSKDPGWIFAFVDPQQLGVHVEIPHWLANRKGP